VALNSGSAFDWSQNRPQTQKPTISMTRVIRGRRPRRFCWNDMAGFFYRVGCKRVGQIGEESHPYNSSKLDAYALS
jgi:hypothetical protein